MWTIHGPNGHQKPSIAPNSPIGGHEAMEPWDHPRAMEAVGCHRWSSGTMHGPHYFTVSGIICVTIINPDISSFFLNTLGLHINL